MNLERRLLDLFETFGIQVRYPWFRKTNVIDITLPLVLQGTNNARICETVDLKRAHASKLLAMGHLGHEVYLIEGDGHRHVFVDLLLEMIPKRVAHLVDKNLHRDKKGRLRGPAFGSDDIDLLRLSSRTYSALWHLPDDQLPRAYDTGMKISDVCQLSRIQLLKQPRFAKKSLKCLEDALAQRNLKLNGENVCFTTN